MSDSINRQSSFHKNLERHTFFCPRGGEEVELAGKSIGKRINVKCQCKKRQGKKNCQWNRIVYNLEVTFWPIFEAYFLAYINWPKYWTDVVNCCKGQEKSIQDFWILPIGLSTIKWNKSIFIFFTFISFLLVPINDSSFVICAVDSAVLFVIRLYCNKSSNFLDWAQFVYFIPCNRHGVNLRLIFVLRMGNEVAVAYNSQQFSSFDLSWKIQNFVVLDIQNIQSWKLAKFFRNLFNMIITNP